MIKLVYCVHRRADVSPESFSDYWRHQHGPRVARCAAAIGALRYVQSHTLFGEATDIARQVRGADEPYDGITEIWWADMESLQAGAASPEGQTAYAELITDEATFVDLARSSLFFTEEHTIFDHTDSAQ